MDVLAKSFWRAGLGPCLGAVVLAGSWAGAGGQTPTTSQPPSNCGPIQDAQGNMTSNPACPNATSGSAPPVGAGQRFPYPGETQPAAPATNDPAPSAAVPQNGVDGNQTAAPGQPAAKRFPYPGETDGTTPATSPANPTAPVPGQPPLSDAGSSGSSSSSSGSSSSSSAGASDSSGGSGAAGKAGGGDPDTDPDAAAAPRRNRHKLPAVPRQSPSEQEEEDVKVAGFYQNDGNFKGAYARAKDAVSLDADDPAAQLALAESARRLGKLDEAEKAYRQCLELDPVPKLRKKAEEALKEMTGGN